MLLRGSLHVYHSFAFNSTVCVTCFFRTDDVPISEKKLLSRTEPVTAVNAGLLIQIVICLFSPIANGC
jgi:hypothetical protein